MPEVQKTMTGKICLVTGATSGLGAAMARLLAEQGATVIGVGRDPTRCSRGADRIKAATGNPSVEFLRADLSVQSEIGELARQIKKRHERLDVLINNAGARFSRRLVSADGLEMTFALNHLGYFLLTCLLLDELKRSGHGRIINIASAAHRSCPGIKFEDLQGGHGYDGKEAYAQSKLANLLFTYELDRQLRGTGVTANAVDPGNVMSGFSRNNGIISWARHLFGSLRSGGLSGARQAAKTGVYLASSPEVQGLSGNYYHRKRIVDSSAVSYDADLARRLWRVSLELVLPGSLPKNHHPERV